MILRGFYRKLYAFYMIRKKPVEYAKKIGVNFPGGGGYTYMGALLGEVSLG